MTTLSDQDRARIGEAIAAAEKSTAAEIICVVTRSSSDYWAAPFLWAALAALIWPWPLIAITNLSASTIYLTQLVVYAVVALALSFPKSRRMSLTPPWIRRRRAHLSAREHFFTQGLHRTVNRSGVLIFVSAAERYAEILTDDSVAVKVGDPVWRPIVEDLRGALERGRIADGMVAAVSASSVILGKELPPRENDRNELPDKVIVI